MSPPDDLSETGTCLENFGLLTPNRDVHFLLSAHVLYKMKCFDTSEQAEESQKKTQNISCLNSQHEMTHKMILASALGDGDGPGMFFINAAGGYGKAFFMEMILSSIHSAGKIALAIASSGIAAELLEGGRTAHSHFKIPILISD